MKESADIFGQFRDCVRKYEARAFLEDPGGDWRVTYGQALAAVERLSALLESHACRTGDRIAVLAPNSPSLLLLALAAVRIGAALAVIPHETHILGAKDILGQVEPRLVFYDRGCFRHDELGAHGILLSMESLEEAMLSEAIKSESTPPPVDSESLAFLIFTSGSTGGRKGVMISHGNVLFTSAAIQQRLQYRATDRILLLLPLAFDYGLYQVFLAMNTGACLLVGDNSQVGPGLLGLMEAKQVSVLPGIPTLLLGILVLLRRRPNPLPHLRCATNTGEHLPDELVSEFQEKLPAVQLFLMYGITECKRISILLPKELAERPGSVGRCLEGTTVRVANEDRKELKRSGTGELVVAGKHVTLGYWRDEKATSRDFSDDPDLGRIFFTGDKCTIDDAGFIHFNGRIDSLIKRKGYRINPLEIEKEAAGIPGIDSAVVLQEPETKRILLFVTGASATAEGGTLAIQERLSERLERFKQPDEIHVLQEFPTTPNGKVDRPFLLARMRGQVGRA